MQCQLEQHHLTCTTPCKFSKVTHAVGTLQSAPFSTTELELDHNEGSEQGDNNDRDSRS